MESALNEILKEIEQSNLFQKDLNLFLSTHRKKISEEDSIILKQKKEIFKTFSRDLRIKIYNLPLNLILNIPSDIGKTFFKKDQNMEAMAYLNMTICSEKKDINKCLNVFTAFVENKITINLLSSYNLDISYKDYLLKYHHSSDSKHKSNLTVNATQKNGKIKKHFLSDLEDSFINSLLLGKNLFLFKEILDLTENNISSNTKIIKNLLYSKKTDFFYEKIKYLLDKRLLWKNENEKVNLVIELFGYLFNNINVSEKKKEIMKDNQRKITIDFLNLLDAEQAELIRKSELPINIKALIDSIFLNQNTVSHKSKKNML